ncbi:TIGR02444 family protein [Litoribacillus peritrichatus]|uniref:TIGR02444 family protein n=1 Tax=Litoribacillus peritrichatus TaxID=718191 RepID=A0ABP7NDZ2_9GAMM
MSLWSFACALYAEPGVEPALLQLQDEHGVSVNHLLAVSWLHAQRRSPADWSTILVEERQLALNEKVILPIRDFRRSCKGGVSDLLYQQLKALELVGEQAQLRWLETRLLSQRSTNEPMPHTGTAEKVTLYQAVTDYVVANASVSDADVVVVDSAILADGEAMSEKLDASLTEFACLAERGMESLTDAN